MNSIKHVIFDWAGTLYDDHLPSFHATREILRQLAHVDLSFEEYQREFNLPAIGFYHKCGIKKTIHEINRIYFDLYKNYIGEGKLFEGVLETLKFLKRQKVTVSVFSTVRQDLLDEQISRLKLGSFFINVEGSVNDKRVEMKRHLKGMRIKKNEVLFIGDMAHDVEAANHNGLISGGVVSGYHDLDQLLEEKPRFVWQHQKDWMPFFKSLVQKKKIKTARDYPVATSGALVLNKDKEVLLVLTPKWDFTYGIPGGKIEKNETASKACQRELKEETGLNVVVKDLIQVLDCINSKEFYIPESHFILFNYLATTNQKKVSLNDEACSYLWIKPDQALRLKLNDPTRKLIEVYLKSFV